MPLFAYKYFSGHSVFTVLLIASSWLFPICSITLTMFIQEVTGGDEIDGTSETLLPADGDGGTEKKSNPWWSYLALFLFSKSVMFLEFHFYRIICRPIFYCSYYLLLLAWLTFYPCLPSIALLLFISADLIVTSYSSVCWSNNRNRNGND